MTWAYKTENAQWGDLEETLNVFAKDGWHLVQAFDDEGMVYFILARQEAPS